MSRDVISVEVDNPGRSVPQWEAAQSRHVGKVPPELRDQEITRCLPASTATFRGRLEYGALGDDVLYKVRSTPNRFSRSLCSPRSTTIPSPIILVVELNGCHRVRQSQNSYVLRPGDWCLLDMLLPLDYWTPTESSEFLALTIQQRPPTPEQRDLLDREVASQIRRENRYCSGSTTDLGRSLRPVEQRRTRKRLWIAQRCYNNGLGLSARTAGNAFTRALSRYPTCPT